MKVKDNDLVVATNGRGIFILDDITPIREQRDELNIKPVHLYPIPDHTRFGYNWWIDYVPGGDPGDKKNYFVQNMRPGLTFYEIAFKPVNGERKRKFIDAGDPKPLGVMMYFRLKSEPKEVMIEILNANDEVIRTYTKAGMSLNHSGENSMNAGLNRFVWDMRIDMVTGIPKRPPTAIRPIVNPGKYKARLTVDGESQTQEFELFINPKEPYTSEEAKSRFDFWMDIYNEAEGATQKVLKALEQKEIVAEKIKVFKESGAKESKIENAEQQSEKVIEVIDTYEGSFVSTGRTLAEIINLPATILSRMAFISTILEQSEGPPNQQTINVFEELKSASVKATAEFDANFKVEMEKLEKLLR
jgi:hypothetical protein